MPKACDGAFNKMASGASFQFWFLGSSDWCEGETSRRMHSWHGYQGTEGKLKPFRGHKPFNSTSPALLDKPLKLPSTASLIHKSFLFNVKSTIIRYVSKANSKRGPASPWSHQAWSLNCKYFRWVMYFYSPSGFSCLIEDSCNLAIYLYILSIK